MFAQSSNIETYEYVESHTGDISLVITASVIVERLLGLDTCISTTLDRQPHQHTPVRTVCAHKDVTQASRHTHFTCSTTLAFLL